MNAANLLNKVQNFVNEINRVLGIIAASTIALIGLSTLTDAIGRDLGHPIAGAMEFNELLLVVVVFCGLGVAQHSRSHIAVEALTRILSKKDQLIVDLLTLILSCGITGVVVFGTIVQAWESSIIGQYKAGAASFPVYPSKIILAFGCSYLLLVLGIQICGALRQLLGHPRDRL